MSLWALLVPLAVGGVGLDGASGLLTVPTAETLPAGRAQASAGLQLGRGIDGVTVVGLPGGIAVGVAPRLEVGARLERDVWVVWPAEDQRSSAGVHARWRLIDPVRARPALAVQVDVEGIGARAGAAVTVVASAALARPLQLHAAVTGRTIPTRTTDLVVSTGAELWVSSRIRLVGEVMGAIDARGVHQWAPRAGVRVRVRDRVTVLGWGGGGRDDGRPWAGGGLAVELSSVEPSKSDIDADRVVDWRDRCPTRAEDLDRFEDTDGCVDVDNDHDGLPDTQDATPNGEIVPQKNSQWGIRPQLKMRIKPRPLPGPVDPAKRGGTAP